MTIPQSILLGIIQGLTEFLPISSSGHLVIIPYLLGWDIPAADAFVFDVLVQVATLLAVFIYFWVDITTILRAVILGMGNKKPFDDPLARLGWFIILSTLPAGAIGLALKDAIERAFANPTTTAGFLLITASFLLFSERVGKRQRTLDDLTWIDALWIGFSQALAIFPGISRSGITITGGMVRNLKRPAAARFAFLMSIPIMLAAGLAAIVDLAELSNNTTSSGTDLETILVTFIPGLITAAIVGYLSIRWLLGYLNHHPIYVFAAYCAILGFVVLIMG